MCYDKKVIIKYLHVVILLGNFSDVHIEGILVYRIFIRVQIGKCFRLARCYNAKVDELADVFA